MRYDYDNIPVLRLQTEDLCAKLDELHAQLMNGTVRLEDLKEDFDHLLQPKAISLAEAMLRYVPDDDFRLMNVHWIGNVRNYVYGDMETLKAPLLANSQLFTVARILRDLVTALPTPAHP